MKTDFPRFVRRLQLLILLAAILWGGGGISAFEYFEAEIVDRVILFFYDDWKMPWSRAVRLTMIVSGLLLIIPLIGLLILHIHLEKRFGSLRFQSDRE